MATCTDNDIAIEAITKEIIESIIDNVIETVKEPTPTPIIEISTTTTKNDTNVDIKNIIGFIENFKEFRQGVSNTENTQNNGKVFENFVKDKFVSIGYTDMTSEKKGRYKNLIDTIKKNYDECLQIQNTNNYKCEKMLIQQPNGSQKPPDLLLIEITTDMIQFQPIEVKTGKDNATWNNTYPKNDWIYIFSGRNGVTYFSGKSLISNDIVKIFDEYKELRKKLTTDYNQKLKDLKSNWKLVDYFKFEHTSGVNYKKDDMCVQREKDVDDVLLKFMGLMIH